MTNCLATQQPLVKEPAHDIVKRSPYQVTKVLVQALGVEEDDIKPSATLQADLGAESIDFLDIVFRLEREFEIKIRAVSCSLSGSSSSPRRSCKMAG